MKKDNLFVPENKFFCRAKFPLHPAEKFLNLVKFD